MRTMKLRRHTPPLPATCRESTAAHPPPLRCAHGSGPPRLRMEAPSTAMPAAPAVYAPRLGPAGSACVSLPAQFSRLRRLPFAVVAHAGCAYTASALGMAYRKAYLRRRVDTSRRRALRYGRWAAASSRSPAGGGGVWGSARHRFCGRMGRQRATGDIWRPRGRHMPARSRVASRLRSVRTPHPAASRGRH